MSPSRPYTWETKRLIAELARIVSLAETTLNGLSNNEREQRCSEFTGIYIEAVRRIKLADALLTTNTPSERNARIVREFIANTSAEEFVALAKKSSPDLFTTRKINKDK